MLLIVLNIYFSIFKALEVLNLTAGSLKVTNLIFVKSSLSIGIMVVFITFASRSGHVVKLRPDQSMFHLLK